ncbi:hypothetical protein, partial [Enterobacter hormaechei]|uniref:hypothetical protein n=1 Tax=Enterobacter hormaechei TaxID=158836 RepID=UPI00203FED9E
GDKNETNGIHRSRSRILDCPDGNRSDVMQYFCDHIADENNKQRQLRKHGKVKHDRLRNEVVRYCSF